MPLHNYSCANDHLTKDVYSSSSTVQRTIDCPACGEAAVQDWRHYKDGQGASWQLKSAGYQKGIDPQTGVEYQHYADRQKVLRDQGLDELGAPLTVEQVREQEYDQAQEDHAQRTAHETQPILQAESIEDLNAMIAGDMKQRQVLNPEHGLRNDEMPTTEDGWISF